MLTLGRHKESTTLFANTTGRANFKVNILPVGNGSPRELPEIARQQTKWMIVDGHVHSADSQILHGALKLDLIFVRIDPKFTQIRPGEPRYFESHQGDVSGEW